MKNSRVIMIDGSHSGWYEKAIFILTEQGQNKEVSNNMVDEAEKIVEEYLKKQLRNETNNRDYKVKHVDHIQRKTKQIKNDKSFKLMRMIAIISMLICIISLINYLL